MNGSIVVIGATGHVGRNLVQRLAEAGEQVVGVATHFGDIDRVPGVTYVEEDMTKPDAATRVVRNATAVFLTLPENNPDPLETERQVAHNVIEAARLHDTPHLVVATALHADREHTGVPLIDNKYSIEAELVGSGVPYTILRPGLFLETIVSRVPHDRRDELALPLPGGHPVGVVSARDVATAAAAFLLGDPANRAFDMHVPGGVRAEDLRRVQSQMMERPIGFKELRDDVDAFVGGLDMPPEERALYADYFAYLRNHTYLGQPEDIQLELTGFRYATLESFFHADDPRVRQFRYGADEPTDDFPGRHAP